MAGMDRMTILEVVRDVLRDEHADVIRESVRAVAQELIEVEVSELIGAAHGERTEDRATHRNGYRPRRWDTRAGQVELQIPKIRQGSYFPSFLQPRKRSEQALVAVVQQAYVCGVSTRRVDQLVESLGLRVSVDRRGLAQRSPHPAAGYGPGESKRSTTQPRRSVSVTAPCTTSRARRSRSRLRIRCTTPPRGPTSMRPSAPARTPSRRHASRLRSGARPGDPRAPRWTGARCRRPVRREPTRSISRECRASALSRPVAVELSCSFRPSSADRRPVEVCSSCGAPDSSR
jgi:Transposase, Mutator family